MIYGRISDIYLSVITLVVTLIFEKTIRSTSGPEYMIGSVRLKGQNGLPGHPGACFSLGRERSAALRFKGIFYLTGGLLLAGLCRLAPASHDTLRSRHRRNPRKRKADAVARRPLPPL